MSTIQYSVRSAQLSVRRCKWAWPKVIIPNLINTNWNKMRRDKTQQLFANVIAALLTYNACAFQWPSFQLFYWMTWAWPDVVIRPRLLRPSALWLVFGNKTTRYGKIFKILFRKFIATSIDVLCSNYGEFGRRKIGEIVRCLPDKKTKFRLAHQLSLLGGSHPTSALASSHHHHLHHHRLIKSTVVKTQLIQYIQYIKWKRNSEKQNNQSVYVVIRRQY